eukprot:4584786-Pleurochrysis_carterae.AAC.2
MIGTCCPEGAAPAVAASVGRSVRVAVPCFTDPHGSTHPLVAAFEILALSLSDTLGFSLELRPLSPPTRFCFFLRLRVSRVDTRMPDRLLVSVRSCVRVSVHVRK